MTFHDLYENLQNIDHIYIVENIPINETEEEFEDIFSEGCNCINICTIETCSCLKKYGINYVNSEDNQNYTNYTLETSKNGQGFYECNSACKCENSICGNKLVQYGPRSNLEIRDCNKILFKGKGLFTTANICKGNFICEYAGEVITKSEALKRFQHNEKHDLINYILCVKENFGSNKIITFIDPSYFGNIGRYANHSCNPNCELIPVRVNNTIPKLCIFAKKDIDKNIELTFSYGENRLTINDKYNLKPCLCGEENCRKWLPFLSEICE